MHDAKVRDLATRDLLVVSPDDSVVDVARLVAASGTEAAVAVTNDQPVGIVTEHDLVQRVLAAGIQPSSCTVADVMTSPVRTLDAAQPAAEAARIMALHQLRHIPLLEDGRLAGMVTDRDLIAYSPILFEAARDDAYERGPTPTFESAICEGCETLSAELHEVDGALLCEDCVDAADAQPEVAQR